MTILWTKKISLEWVRRSYALCCGGAGHSVLPWPKCFGQKDLAFCLSAWAAWLSEVFCCKLGRETQLAKWQWPSEVSLCSCRSISVWADAGVKSEEASCGSWLGLAYLVCLAVVCMEFTKCIYLIFLCVDLVLNFLEGKEEEVKQ